MDSEIESAMVEQEEISDPRTESFSDRISDKIRSGDARSSSSDSEPDYKQTTPESSVKEEVKEEIHRLLSREKPVHKVFGGGTPADVFLWRNNKVSASVLGGATTVWVLFELLEYHLLTLVCHIAILVLSLSFFWSNASVLVNKKPPNFPEVRLPPEPFQEVASALLSEINHAFAVLRQISSGRDLKKFLWEASEFPRSLPSPGAISRGCFVINHAFAMLGSQEILTGSQDGSSFNILGWLTRDNAPGLLHTKSSKVAIPWPRSQPLPTSSNLLRVHKERVGAEDLEEEDKK